MVDNFRESLAKLSDKPLTEEEKDEALFRVHESYKALRTMWRELKTTGYTYNRRTKQLFKPDGALIEETTQKSKYELYRLEE